MIKTKKTIDQQGPCRVGRTREVSTVPISGLKWGGSSKPFPPFPEWEEEVCRGHTLNQICLFNKHLNQRCVGEELGKALVFLTLASVLRWVNPYCYYDPLFLFSFPGHSRLVWLMAMHGGRGFMVSPCALQTTQYPSHLSTYKSDKSIS